MAARKCGDPSLPATAPRVVILRSAFGVTRGVRDPDPAAGIRPAAYACGMTRRGCPGVTVKG